MTFQTRGTYSSFNYFSLSHSKAQYLTLHTWRDQTYTQIMHLSALPKPQITTLYQEPLNPVPKKTAKPKKKKNKMSIVEEAPGYIQVFSDGSVKRFAPETASASDQETSLNGLNFKSKDVIIDPSKPITARIFLPENTPSSTDSLLPLLVYFHGGGFCIGSTAWLGYHRFLGDLSAALRCVVVSVDYRLAPENRLPAAYEDGCTALDWISTSVRGRSSEPWLDGADLSRVFLSGDSAGGNIAHNVAVRTAIAGLEGVKIAGLLLVHPYFGSEERTEREAAAKGAERDVVAMNDMFWRLSVPQGESRNYFGCNFEAGAGAESEAPLRWREFPAVAVFVAGRDFLKERGVMYARFLERNGVGDVRLVEAEDECHVFHVFYPESEATRLLQRQMSEFINSAGY